GSRGPGRRGWAVAGAAAAALVVGGAGIALGMALSGGGEQPEDVMPANALFFADVDLDPDAGQKVNLLRLLSKFPDVQDELGGRDDIKSYVVEQLLESDPDWAAEDVTPWVGDRAGVAVYWDEDTKQPYGLLAVETADEGAAEASLSNHLDDSEWTLDQGYAVIRVSAGVAGEGSMASAADLVSGSKEASLANDPDFVSIMDPLGSGIASLYLDGAGVTDLVNNELGFLGYPGAGTMGMGSDAMAGQVGAVVRVEPSAIELIGRSTEAGTLGADPTGLIGSLPSSTAAAFAMTGGGDAVAKQWDALMAQLDTMGSLGMGMTDMGAAADGLEPVAFMSPSRASGAIKNEFERGIAEFERQYNVQLPDDLVTLFGDDLVVALDGDGLIGSVPNVGLRSVTDPAAAADLATRLQPVIDDLTAGYGVVVEPVDDGLVVASSSEYADQLANGEGGLLDDPAFVAAVPDAEKAAAVLWVDVDALGSFAALYDPASADVWDPLQGVGVSAGVDVDGGFFRARVTFDE
ncbi:MAG: hypothetical protein ABI586_06955, partial [Candidatus Nanopelagicales bacterium]